MGDSVWATHRGLPPFRYDRDAKGWGTRSFVVIRRETPYLFPGNNLSLLIFVAFGWRVAHPSGFILILNLKILGAPSFAFLRRWETASP